MTWTASAGLNHEGLRPSRASLPWSVRRESLVYSPMLSRASADPGQLSWQLYPRWGRYTTQRLAGSIGMVRARGPAESQLQ